MKIPLQISSRKLSLSSSTIEVIKHKVQKLELFFDKIIACRIMVETPHRHKNHGSLYNVTIDISIPGGELVVKREANEDMLVAVRDAFEAARRQIAQHSKKRKGKQPRNSRMPNNTPVMSAEDDFQMSDLLSSENFLDDFSLNELSLGRTATSFA